MVVKVWVQCEACKAQHSGPDGFLFCPACGGPLQRIGYVTGVK